MRVCNLMCVKHTLMWAGHLNGKYGEKAMEGDEGSSESSSYIPSSNSEFCGYEVMMMSNMR